MIDMWNDQRAFIASPEKALLDLVYLQPGGDSEEYLRALRLQAMDQMDMEQLHQLASETGRLKLLRAVEVINRIVEEETTGYEPL